MITLILRKKHKAISYKKTYFIYAIFNQETLMFKWADQRANIQHQEVDHQDHGLMQNLQKHFSTYGTRK